MARKPFFSGNYGSALARVDTRPIMEAGRAQGQMYANMGKQIGGMIQQYGLNKEKRNKLQATLEGQLSADPSVMQALTMTGDEAYDKKNQTLFDKVQSGNASIPDLERANGLLAGKTTQENAMMKKSAFELSQLTQQLSNDNTSLRNEIAELTKDSVVSGAESDARAKTTKANMLGVDEAYQKTDKALGRKNIQSQIDYRNAASLSMLLKQNNINAPVPKDLEKRYSEISTLLPKLDNTKIKVKTTGTFGTGFGAEEKEITYSEYKENPDDYAPLVTDQLKGLQLQENTLKEELSQLTLSTPIPYTNDDTGAQGITTVGEMLKFQKQSKNNTPTNPQSMPLGQEDMMMLDQPGTTIGVPQVPNFSR